MTHPVAWLLSLWNVVMRSEAVPGKPAPSMPIRLVTTECIRDIGAQIRPAKLSNGGSSRLNTEAAGW